MTLKKKKQKTIEAEILEKELFSSTKYRLRKEEYKNRYHREDNKQALEEALDEIKE